MPRYDYKCPQCDHLFEVRHGFNDPAPACPNCGFSEPVKQITSAPSIAHGMLTPAGDSRRSSQEQLQEKWREETPKLRKKLVDKFGEEKVNRAAPTLNANYD